MNDHIAVDGWRARRVLRGLAAAVLPLGLAVSVAPVASAVPAPTSANLRACQQYLAKAPATGWKVACAARGKAYTLDPKKRVVTVNYALTYKKDKGATYREVKRATKVLTAKAKAPAKVPAKAIPCTATKDLSPKFPGWKVVCSSTIPTSYALDVRNRVITVNMAYYMGRDSTVTVIDRALDSLPIPKNLTPAQQSCQVRVSALYEKVKTRTNWFVYCMDVPEMPKINDRYGHAGGLTYGYDRTILVNASMTDEQESGVFTHEWGHAMTEDFTPQYRAQIARDAGLPWVSGSDIFGSMTESMAESFRGCTTGSFDSRYPRIPCSKLKDLYAKGGVDTSRFTF